MKPVNQQRNTALLHMALKTRLRKLKGHSIKQRFMTLAAFTCSGRFVNRYPVYSITVGAYNLHVISPLPF
jgi:hypothetical protein